MTSLFLGYKIKMQNVILYLVSSIINILNIIHNMGGKSKARVSDYTLTTIQ